MSGYVKVEVKGKMLKLTYFVNHGKRVVAVRSVLVAKDSPEAVINEIDQGLGRLRATRKE